MTVDPREQREQARAGLDPARVAEIDRIAARIRGRRATWARRRPTTTRQALEDFDAAEARVEREKENGW